MKRLLLVLCLASSPSFAQTPASDQAKSLTYDQVKQVAEGLSHLDGYDKLAKDGAREFIVKEFYKFKKGLRALIADDISKLRPALRDLGDKNNDLIREYAEGTEKVLDKNLIEFTAAQRKLLDSPSGVAPAHIKLDEMDLDANPIPASVLSLIDPILDK